MAPTSAGGWASPDITSNKEMGAGWMSPDDMVEYLKIGATHGTVASGPMAEAIEHSFQYLDEKDLRAIATYVLSLPPSDLKKDPGFKFSKDKEAEEYHNYEVNCSACHGVEGEGIKGMVPAIAGNNRITTRYYTNLIHAMLMGTRAAHTQTLQTAAGMPSFAWKMDDQQIADMLTYIRNAFGNQGSRVKVDDVAKMRKELGARQKVTNVKD
ncbi:cytochrome c [Breoghania sp.]|uniref:c-type cytochrome n=1 Tax=Breoghania sp. TaxID=2065378 RepID=UPI002611C3EC|nr:cytochrome c [Breoghania sp.]MDJ0931007.1 cytochrome c [Breoghania sp.]